MTTHNDDDPPLLQGWLTFRELVLQEEGRPEINGAMMTFYGGAGTVLSLLKSAAEQGGSKELDYALAVLLGEVEAFQNQMIALRERAERERERETMQ